MPLLPLSSLPLSLTPQAPSLSLYLSCGHCLCLEASLAGCCPICRQLGKQSPSTHTLLTHTHIQSTHTHTPPMCVCVCRLSTGRDLWICLCTTQITISIQFLMRFAHFHLPAQQWHKAGKGRGRREGSGEGGRSVPAAVVWHELCACNIIFRLLACLTHGSCDTRQTEAETEAGAWQSLGKDAGHVQRATCFLSVRQQLATVSLSDSIARQVRFIASRFTPFRFPAPLCTLLAPL